MDTITGTLRWLLIIVFAAIVLQALIAHEARAHHPGESPALSAGRDALAMRRCVPMYAGRRSVCEGLVKGTHLARVPRRWSFHPDLANLLYRESSWNPAAYNPAPCSAGGNAVGLFQFCRRTWVGAGCKYYGWGAGSPNRRAAYQARCGYRYLANRYGTPRAAWHFWLKNHWY